MANLRVELRKRTGSTYGDKVLVATEASLVEGLLNPDGKIKENLFPTSVFGGLKFVSSISEGSSGVNAGLANLVDNSAGKLQLSADLTTMGGATPTSSNIDLFRGMYFIVSSPIELIAEGSTHFNDFTTDDGHPIPSPGHKLSPGDWVVCTGWSNNYYDEPGVEFSIVNNTYGKAASNSDGLMSKEHFTKLNGIAEGANNYTLPTASASVKGGLKIGSRLSMAGEVLSADSQTENNFTTVLKSKLDLIEAGANKYIHPTDGVAATHTLTSVESVSQLKINSAGHVTGFSKQAIRAASDINTGISRFATSEEGRAASLETVGVTPYVLSGVINYAVGLPVFANIAAANSAAAYSIYKDGSFAFVEV